MYEYVVARGEFAGYCIATQRFLLALHPGLHGSISAIWPILGSPSTHLEDVFARLIERGISQAPDFAIAELVDPVERAVSVVVHGRATAQLLDDPASAMSGQGLSTWRESIWTGVSGFMLGTGDDRSGSERLPITGGVVRADWIRWSADPMPIREATTIPEAPAATADAEAAAPRRSRHRRPVGEPAAEPAAEPVAPMPAEGPGSTATAPMPVVPAGAQPDAPDDTTGEGPILAAPLGDDGTGSEPLLGDILSRPAVRLPDGSLVHPDFPLVVGRRPTVGLSASGAPTVPVVVGSPQRVVSASHLQIEAAGRAVLLRDLGTRNGSLIRKPRSQPFVLGGGAEALVPVGTTIDLGDGVVLEIVLG